MYSSTERSRAVVLRSCSERSAHLSGSFLGCVLVHLHCAAGRGADVLQRLPSCSVKYNGRCFAGELRGFAKR